MWSKEFLIPESPISEDCLYLNVWSDATTTGSKKPVLVWIYGGGFSSGGSACPIYDGEAMARKGIVFVSINYRVGVFGFMAHPEITDGGRGSGNFGLLDQIAGLKWVQQNIAAFGGDPKNVTIAGQSAGSMSVNCLVASPLAKGLFNKAIAQSGANFTRGNTSREQAETEGKKWVASLGAATLNDLRKRDAAELMAKASGMRGPYIDGLVLPKSIREIFAEKSQNNVALITGWNQDEGLVFGPLKNAAQHATDIQTQFGNHAEAIMKYFPAKTDAEAIQAQLDLSRDMTFGLQGFIWSDMQAAQGLPVYTYRFTRIVPAEGEYKKYKAFHTGEVPYAYNNLGFVNRPWEPADRKLASQMSDYWVNFMKTGNPNGGSLPSWPAYRQQDRMTMYFDVDSKAKTMHDAQSLEALNEAMKK